ncbi:hypothetical protein ElyMa_000841200 [Elysia marginata]|uniref:Uncharacterized protein n=1 Tax=Elysia marginata TaxID=1093978 RepID=A0AAV4H1K3_9GAST|nr:hypothetical protein ElyMa_000841200 [Elysia marginata]
MEERNTPGDGREGEEVGASGDGEGEELAPLVQRDPQNIVDNGQAVGSGAPQELSKVAREGPEGHDPTTPDADISVMSEGTSELKPLVATSGDLQAAADTKERLREVPDTTVVGQGPKR